MPHVSSFFQFWDHNDRETDTEGHVGDEKLENEYVSSVVTHVQALGRCHQAATTHGNQ